MAAGSRTDRIWNRVIGGTAVAVLLTLVTTAVIVLGGVGKPTYSQATPDDVVRSAVLMVKNGHAKYLPDLIYADSDEMRGSLKRLGILLGHLQELAGSIKTRFPEEIERYRLEAEAEIASGKPPAMLGALMGGLGGNRSGGPPGPPDADQERAVRDLIARIFADPYGWIEQNEDRLSTIQVTDDLASILLDGNPVAGVGLALKLDGDKWYLALPTNIPPVSRVMPKAPGQWKMINSLVKILDNTVLELNEDVSQGRLSNLKGIGDKAQEKILFPAGIWFAAYAADMDARGRIDRNQRQFRDRQRAWAKSREERAGGSAEGVTDGLTRAMSEIAGPEIEKLVRARKAPRWGEMSNSAFEAMVGEWLSARGLKIDLSAPLDRAAVDAALAGWKGINGRELASKSKK